MSEIHDTSPIPDESAYWDDLAARVAARAVHRDGALDWLAAPTATWLTLLTIACAAGVLLVLTRSSPAPLSVGREWALVLAPSDEVGRRVSSSETPPALLGLVLGARAAPGGGR